MLGTKRHLGLLFQDAEIEETLREDLHGRFVRRFERRAGLDGVDARLLGGEHQFVDASLGRGVLPVDRHRARDVGGVEVVALDARVEQEQVAPSHGAGVAHPVQHRRVRAAGGDRVVAGVVALDARAQVEDTFDDPFAATFGGRECAHDVLETFDGVVDGQLELRDLEIVLDQTMFAERRGQDLVVLVRFEIVVDPRVEATDAHDLGGRQVIERRLE